MEVMKENRLTLTIFVIGCILLPQFGCQDAGSAAPKSEMTGKTAGAAEKGEPNIVFEKVIHNFGELGPETVNPCEFKFANTGKGVLKIDKVESTCGCTVPKLSKDEYAPGESGIIHVNYHADTRIGPTTKVLYVLTNVPTSPKVTLTLKARIVEKIKYEPTSMTLSPGKENAGCPNITITSLDGQPFVIKSFKSIPNYISVDYNASTEVTTFVLQPKVDVEKLREGPDSGSIEISLTHPALKQISIPFQVLPRFKVSPPAIIVFDARPGAPIKREVWVLNNYDEDFEIESTSSKKGIIKVLSQEKFGKRYKFELEITAPSAEGKPKIFTDTFTVDIKGGEKLEITCRGFYPREKSEKDKPAGKE